FKPTFTIDRAHFAAFMARIIEPSFQPKNSQMADSYLEAILDVQPVDYDSHPTEPIIYLLDGNTNEVVSFNYDTYEIKSVPLDYPAERLTFANNKLYVTLLKGTHSAYWFDENQQGAFGVVDASTMTLENIIHIDLDPYDIEADDQGIVYVTSGSGQHSRIESYDGKTGKRLSSQRIYYQSLIDMHPSQNKIYAITTTVTPRNITAYPITEGILGTEQRSPYHGTYPLNKDITVSPDGKYLFNSTGHIFRSSAAASSDMHYFAKLDRPYQSIAFDLEYGELYLSDNKKYVQAYDYFTMEPIGQLTTYGNIQKMYYDEQNHVLVLFSTVQLGNSTVPFTGIEKIYFDIEENEERQ
ncbi:MAG TPA: hypothetical protein VEY51_01615, partial [Chondromyces sp.]|nr:hypothetical protein [Chondromyces sp.]